MLKILLLAVSLAVINGIQEDDFLGCYKNWPSTYFNRTGEMSNVKDCLNFCKSNFYKYSIINESLCGCINFLQEEVNATQHCSSICLRCDMKPLLSDVYFTGNLVPGPPRFLRIENITDVSAHFFWTEPESYTDILYYEMKALVLHTYSSYSPNSPEWMFSNNTFKTVLITLQPSTKYNFTIRAVSENGEGPMAYAITETKIGEPDNHPPQPVVLDKGDTTITVKLNSVVNNNGPVTLYQVIVINDNAKEGFRPENLKSIREAQREGYNYYIAAELEPRMVDREFVIGDGRYYGKYYNAPLNSTIDYHIILGLVSRLNDTVKFAYSDLNAAQNGVIVLNVTDDPITDSPIVVITLSIAIALLSCVLLAGLIGFFILRYRVNSYRQRLTDNQELTLQGPMIEIENSGYIPEEDQPVNHYKVLKQKVKTIPYSQLEIYDNQVLGTGMFGQVNTGYMKEHGDSHPVAIYSIADKKLHPDVKRNMLKDLDVVIRAGKQENVLSLIGTAETLETVSVVFELAEINFKDFLLSSREMVGGKCSTVTEYQVLNIIFDVAKGMNHLANNKVIHKQLCARNIMLTDSLVPKISGYGIVHYFNQKVPDYSRWTASEVFRGLPSSTKSDVWSFACLIWETCVLGGTPYGSIANNEIREKVIRGLRLPQLPYVSSNLYQLMLNCWQLDMDERPDFEQLLQEMWELKSNHSLQHLNFNVYSDFQYEEYYPNLEFTERSVLN